jgi:hypothetical protein
MQRVGPGAASAAEFAQGTIIETGAWQACSLISPAICMLCFPLLLQRVAPGAASAAEFAQGTIIEIEERLPGEDYDPWQAITVLWDDEWSHLNLKSKVGNDLGPVDNIEIVRTTLRVTCCTFQL